MPGSRQKATFADKTIVTCEERPDRIADSSTTAFIATPIHMGLLSLLLLMMLLLLLLLL